MTESSTKTLRAMENTGTEFGFDVSGSADQVVAWTLMISAQLAAAII